MEFAFFLVLCCFLLPALGQEGSDTPAFTWTSPVKGDAYVTGDTIVGTWDTVTDVSSPSFKLCHHTSDTIDPNNSTAAENDATQCGQTVWPVVETNASTSSVSLAVPNITEAGTYLLLMKDDVGDIFLSPSFSLSPAQHNRSQETIASSSQAPSSSASAATFTPPDLSKSGPPVTAIAIPLSLCGALVFTALLFLFRRKAEAKSVVKSITPAPTAAIPAAYLNHATAMQTAVRNNLPEPAMYFPPPVHAMPANRPPENEQPLASAVYRNYGNREPNAKQNWEPVADRIQRRQSFREWLFSRESSIRRRQEEIDLAKEREYRQRCRQLEMEREDLIDGERHEMWGPPGASWLRSTRYPQSRNSSRMSSPSPVGYEPSTRDREQSITATVMDHYTRPSPYMIHKQSSFSRSRSRTRRYLAREPRLETVDEALMFERSSRPRDDVYSAVERAVGTRRSHSPLLR